MTAPVQGHHYFDFKDYRNKNGGALRAAHVDHDAEVPTYGGQVIQVKEGDIIAEAGRPDQYVIVDPDQFSNYAEGADLPKVPAAVEYDPEENSVSSVKAYLTELREDGNQEEFDRVVAAERDGKNRAGIVNSTF